MKIIKIIGGVIAAFFGLIFVIGFVSCAAAINKSDQSGKRATASMSQVSMGMSKAEVISILGKPDDSQHMESEFMGQRSTNDCIYYGTFSDKDWQLCFTDGVLDSKNSY